MRFHSKHEFATSTILLGLLSFALGRRVSPHSCSSAYRLTVVSLSCTWGISSQLLLLIWDMGYLLSLLQCRAAATRHFSATQLLLATSAPTVSISAWIYLWAFYFVPLIYISVFVPVLYCLDDCSFVV